MEPAALPDVVGRNVKRLRALTGLSQADLAETGRNLGVRWSSGAVAQIEAGKYKATIELLAILVTALDFESRRRHGRGVELRDLLTSDHPIAISESHTATTDTLLWFLSGHPFTDEMQLELSSAGIDSVRGTVAQLSEIRRHAPRGLLAKMRESGQVPDLGAVTEHEQRAARDLSIPAYALKLWAVQLWGRSFESERDARAGEGASAQKRGRVTRDLKAEVRTAYEAGHGNDQ